VLLQVIVTTHYQRIKELAAEDARFQIAAMEFVDNKPTYRLRLGAVGESYAIEAGKRMNLPEAVLERAHSLLDDESRRIIALQLRLEEETAIARKKQIELDLKLEEIKAKEESINVDKSKLQEEINKVREGEIASFVQDIRRKEQELDALITKIKVLQLYVDKNYCIIII
jgi:DNA mismatch repair protein MutS2